jgi:hypothetical protein
MSLATRTILSSLSLERLRTLARDFNAEYLWPPTKAAALENLEKCPAVTVPALLDMLLFDELAKVCKALGIDGKAHRRELLVTRLLEADEANGGSPAPAIVPDDTALDKARGAPPPAPKNGTRAAKRLHRGGRQAKPPARPE